MPELYCTNCGKKVGETWKVCGYCGTRLTETEPPAPAEDARIPMDMI